MININEISRYRERRRRRLLDRYRKASNRSEKMRLLLAYMASDDNLDIKRKKSKITVDFLPELYYNIIGVDTSLDGAPFGNDNAAKDHVTKPKKGFGRANFARDGDKMNVTSSVKIKIGKGACTLKEGTVVTDIKDFAGKGCKKGIDVEEHLVSQNKGTATGEWVKSKGNAKVTLPGGKEREAEIHWFEHPEAGQVGMKVKSIKKGTSK